MPHPQDPELRCETCVFWYPPYNPAATLGQCRRASPTHTEDGWWPAEQDEWCGEHPRMALLLQPDEDLEAKQALEDTQKLNVERAALARKLREADL